MIVLTFIELKKLFIREYLKWTFTICVTVKWTVMTSYKNYKSMSRLQLVQLVREWFQQNQFFQNTFCSLNTGFVEMILSPIITLSSRSRHRLQIFVDNHRPISSSSFIYFWTVILDCFFKDFDLQKIRPLSQTVHSAETVRVYNVQCNTCIRLCLLLSYWRVVNDDAVVAHSEHMQTAVSINIRERLFSVDFWVLIIIKVQPCNIHDQ